MGDIKLNVISFKKDAYVTIEGKPTEGYFYIIKSGNVKLVRELGDIPDVILNPGDFFAVLSLMSGQSHTETAIALTDLVLITVTKEQFPQLIVKNAPIAMKIITSFSKKLRELDHAIAEKTFKKTSYVSDSVENIYSIAKYYLEKKEYSLAHYALYKFVKYCTTNEDIVAKANLEMEEIKTLSKAIYLDTTTEAKRIYPNNIMIFCEYEPGYELYIIQSGNVKITKIIDNKEVLLAVLKEGDIFGEMALLENKPRSASAIAYGNANLMVINKENFNSMITTQPQLISRLISLLAERTWVVYRQLFNLSLNNNIGRTYDMLLIQLEKQKISIVRGKKHIFNFGFDELMKMVGLSADDAEEVKNSILMNKRFIVDKNTITVNDIEEIAKEVEFRKKELRRMMAIKKQQNR